MSIPSSLVAAVASTLALASFASLTACGAPAGGDATDAVDESVTAPGGGTYVRLESIATGAYTFSKVNGGKLDCGTGASAKTCTTDKLVLPKDCDWECTDGILSLRGVTVLRGAFKSAFDATAGRQVTSFVAAAGFDTFDATPGEASVYRLTSRPTTACGTKSCPDEIVSTTVNGTSKRIVTRVDFSAAHDTNYRLDPSRGTAQMVRNEGLLTSGKLVAGVFKADRVWRQWSPEADCDVLGAAKAYYFGTTPSADEVDMVFANTALATTYVDPQHRTVKWLVRTDKNTLAIAYTGGVNDLWAQVLSVDTHTCKVTVTGEH